MTGRDQLETTALRGLSIGAPLSEMDAAIAAVRELAAQAREWQQVARDTADNLHEAIQRREARAEAAEADRDRYHETLERIGWHELTWQEARDIARAALAATAPEFTSIRPLDLETKHIPNTAPEDTPQ